jgi:hypothetical protein
MRNTQGKPMAVASVIALGLAMSSSWVVRAGEAVSPTVEQTITAAAGGRAPGERWNTFSAVVTLRRGVVDADHRPVGDRTFASRYHWERMQSGGRWKTTMRMMSGTRPEIVSPSGTSEAIPPDIVRIEDDGDGTGPRFFTRQGTLVRPPTVKDRQKISADDSIFANTDALLQRSSAPTGQGLKIAGGGHDWIEALLPSPDRKDARRTNLQRRFGKPLGRLRGMDRYVETSANHTTELLVDSDWSLPLELNVVRDGQLQSHASFSYEAGSGGSLVRRASHVEHLLPKGVRTALDVELANVRLEDRR